MLANVFALGASFAASYLANKRLTFDARSTLALDAQLARPARLLYGGLGVRRPVGSEILCTLRGETAMMGTVQWLS